MPDALPPEAVTAAWAAWHATEGFKARLTAALQAAAPHLAAAEREACACLAERHGATYWNPDGSTQRLPFADLLREEAPDVT